MLDYNLVHILTSPILILSIYKFMHTFFANDVLNKKIEIISYGVYLSATIIITFFTRIPIILMFLNLSLIFFLTLNYFEKIQKKINVTIFIYALMLTIELIVTVLVGFYEISIFKDNNINSVVGLILIRVITMIVAYLISRYKILVKNDFNIPKIYYLGISIILFGTLYLFSMSLNNTNLTIDGIIFRGLILIVVNLNLMIIDEKIYRSLIIFSNQKILEQQNEAFKSQAHISSEANMVIKSIKHDMNNHLAVLNDLFKNDKKDEFEKYINTIYGELNNENLSNSNNFIFDSIINLKLKSISDFDDINFKLDINIPQNIKILEYDVTVILGNLLDNAIFAMLNSKNKKLHISISENVDCVVILIDNSYNGVILKDGDKFNTIKVNSKEHGLGILNVEKHLKKYDGEIIFDYNNETFSVSVIIPYL